MLKRMLRRVRAAAGPSSTAADLPVGGVPTEARGARGACAAAAAPDRSCVVAGCDRASVEPWWMWLHGMPRVAPGAPARAGSGGRRP